MWKLQNANTYQIFVKTIIRIKNQIVTEFVLFPLRVQKDVSASTLSARIISGIVFRYYPCNIKASLGLWRLFHVLSFYL